MFRASPWISYEPHQRQNSDRTNSNDNASRDTPPISHDLPSAGRDMDAPEISTLREEEEETPPPEGGGLTFSKFRINLRAPARGQGSSAAASGSVVGPPLGPPSANRTIRAPSPPDSDDEDEEDQLIDDDELAIVTETGRAPTTASPGSLAPLGSPAPTLVSRKRGGATRGRQRRGVTGGRRGRPGREPPDAAAMMSTFELTKADEPGASSAQIVPPLPVMLEPPPQVAGSSAGDWSSTTPPKPPRKRPGPKKGSTLGPRGPRKNATRTGHSTPGTATPILDDPLPESSFLIPAAPSIPPTPGSDPHVLPPPHLPPIHPPDFTLDPTIPVPVYPLPTRSFPVQAPPKVPSGYATTHPIDTSRAPVRKWKVAQREIKGIAGGRWFARSWVGERDKDTDSLRQLQLQPAPQNIYTLESSPPLPGRSHAHASSSRPPAWAAPESDSGRIAPEESRAPSRASSIKAEAPVLDLSDPETHSHARWPPASMPVRDADGGLSSRGPGSPRTRTSVSPTPPPPADPHDGPS